MKHFMYILLSTTVTKKKIFIYFSLHAIFEFLITKFVKYLKLNCLQKKKIYMSIAFSTQHIRFSVLNSLYKFLILIVSNLLHLTIKNN